MDASVGLTFSLRLFQRYRRSGILQAEVRHIPGVHGSCTACIHFTAGSVTDCYLENKYGQRLPFPLDDLCQVDRERGPFEWIFQPQLPSIQPQISMPPPLQPPANTSSVPPALNALIPKAVAPLRWEQFHDWTPEQKLLLQNVWKNIDGRHTIQDVKAGLPYPPQMVDDIIQILLTLRIIVLVS